MEKRQHVGEQVYSKWHQKYLRFIMTTDISLFDICVGCPALKSARQLIPSPSPLCFVCSLCCCCCCLIRFNWVDIGVEWGKSWAAPAGICGKSQVCSCSLPRLVCLFAPPSVSLSVFQSLFLSATRSVFNEFLRLFEVVNQHSSQVSSLLLLLSFPCWG